MQADFSYDRRTSPLLPLTEGVFQFLHTSMDRVHDIAARGLRPYPLGRLSLPSGKLVVADPFAGLTRTGNRFALLTPGNYAVWQTLADVTDEQTGGALRTAYLSLVLEPTLLSRRWQWQQERLIADLSPALPPHAMRYKPLIASHEDLDDLNEEEAESAEHACVLIQSGTAAFVDAELFTKFMPPDAPGSGNGWYDRIFEHGTDGSWFDRIDYPEHYRRGAANFPLPGAAANETIVLSQSGWGDGTYFLLAEYGFDYGDRDICDEDDMEAIDEEMLWRAQPPLVALHLDFRVVPFDPTRPTLPVDEG